MTTKLKKKIHGNIGTACLVCHGPAIGINFGVLTCAPCKAFFRRNAVKLGIYEFRCAADGDCPVTSDTRRQCNCCRLARCFRVGMNRAAIRSDDQRLARRRLVEHNRRLRVATREESKHEEISIDVDIPEMIRPVKLLRLDLKDIRSLVPIDQTLLTNIFGAYEQTCIQAYCRPDIIKRSNDTPLTLQNFMNSYSNLYTALIKYAKLIPEFTCLPIDSQVSLIKSNLNHMFRINNAAVVKATGIVQDVKSLDILRLFPLDLFMEMATCAQALFPLAYDPILLKLFIVVLIFSTRLSTRYEMRMNANADNINPQTIVAAQNIYIELMWRYILSRCSNYRQAVQILTSLVTLLLRSQLVQKRMEAHICAENSSNQADQLTPLMRAMWLTDKEK